MTACQQRERDYWTGVPVGSDAGEVTVAEEDVAGVGVAVPVPAGLLVAGAGVWLGVWVTRGVGE